MLLSGFTDCGILIHGSKAAEILFRLTMLTIGIDILYKSIRNINRI